jgi:hypothetical protein
VDPLQVRRIIVGISVLLTVIIAGLGLATRWHLIRQAPLAATPAGQSSTNADTYGPFNSAEEQSKALQDEVDRLQARLKNMQAEKDAPKELDTRSPVLALFPPTVSDQTKSQQLVVAKNFAFAAGNGKEPMTLSFELHNSEPGTSVQKGYIVVLARTKTAMKAYPNVLNPKGPYLVDFERGESFQVSRFRMVNAQFDTYDPRDPVSNFQILIFKRTGELLLNLTTEVSK